MTQEKCQNYLVCNHFVNKSINNLYCKDCLFYFNYTLIFKENKKVNILSSIINKLITSSLLICPICLGSPKLFIKQKSCDHYICSGCIYNIYFDKTYIKNMPINPVYTLKKSWDLYIYSNQSYKFRTKIINTTAPMMEYSPINASRPLSVVTPIVHNIQNTSATNIAVNKFVRFDVMGVDII